MHKTLIITFIFLSATLHAQPGIQWKLNLGGGAADLAQCMAATPDGGCITGGYTASNSGDVSNNHGSFDSWVVKTDSLGTIQWKQTYGGSNGEWPYSIIPCVEGGYIMAGFTLSNDQNVSGNHGDSDAWVVKITNSGSIQWQRCLGGSGHDEAWSIDQTKDGGYILAGRSNSSNGNVSHNHGGYDVWVVKLSKTGAIEWEKSLGGSKEDTGSSIKQTDDGGYIVAGETFSHDGDLNPGSHGDGDYWIVKLNASGGIEWERTFGGTYWERANQIILAKDGGYLCVGTASSSDGDISVQYGGLDIWVIKLDTLGNLVWDKTIGGSKDDWGQAAVALHNDGYAIAGASTSNDLDAIGNHGYTDVLIAVIDLNGNNVWSKSFGGSLSETAYSVIKGNDNNILFSGESFSSDVDVSNNHGQNDFWVVKLNPSSSPTQEIPSRELNIFPNPTQNTTQIQLPTQTRPIALRLFDTFGKEVLHWADFPENGILDLEHLPTGLYWAQVIDLEGNKFSGKILKQ